MGKLFTKRCERGWFGRWICACASAPPCPHPAGLLRNSTPPSSHQPSYPPAPRTTHHAPRTTHQPPPSIPPSQPSLPPSSHPYLTLPQPPPSPTNNDIRPRTTPPSPEPAPATPSPSAPLRRQLRKYPQDPARGWGFCWAVCVPSPPPPTFDVRKLKGVCVCIDD